MNTFILLGKYTQEALKGISTKRTEKATRLIEKFGGQVKAIYASLGAYDLILIAEFPGVNEVLQASVALTKLTGIGFTTSPAIPVEEFDKLVGSR